MLLTSDGITKSKHADTFKANRSRQSTAAQIKKEVTFVTSFFIAVSRTRTIGFQDSCDGNFIVIVPMFRAMEADL